VIKILSVLVDRLSTFETDISLQSQDLTDEETKQIVLHKANINQDIWTSIEMESTLKVLEQLLHEWINQIEVNSVISILFSLKSKMTLRFCQNLK
jgi:hypothetical protein